MISVGKGFVEYVMPALFILYLLFFTAVEKNNRPSSPIFPIMTSNKFFSMLLIHKNTDKMSIFKKDVHTNSKNGLLRNRPNPCCSFN